MKFNVNQELFASFDRLRKASYEVDDVVKIGKTAHAEQIEERLNAPLGHPTSRDMKVRDLAAEPKRGNHTPHSYSLMVNARDKVLEDLVDRVGEDYLKAAQKLIEQWRRLCVVNQVARRYGAKTSVGSVTLDKFFLPGSQRGALKEFTSRIGPHNGLVSPNMERRQLDGEIEKLAKKFEYEVKPDDVRNQS